MQEAAKMAFDPTKDGRTAGDSVEDFITSRWYERNPLIWTPWFIRWAREVGGYCLYANPPQPWGLVVNHRERGLNYGSAQGAESRLVEPTATDAVVKGRASFGKRGEDNRTPHLCEYDSSVQRL